MLGLARAVSERCMGVSYGHHSLKIMSLVAKLFVLIMSKLHTEKSASYFSNKQYLNWYI